MTSKLSNLSVFIITKNEERHIKACIESANFASEVIVVDSGSADQTIHIAGQAGATVIHHEFTDFASQKNFALRQTHGDWVLSLDADERISPELRVEIEHIVQSNLGDAYCIKRVSYIFNKLFKYSGTQNDCPTRLFRRNAGVFEQAIHEVVRIQGKLAILNQPIIHYTLESTKDYIRRLNLYTNLEVRQCKDAKIHRPLMVIARSFARFIDVYVKKLGAFDGAEGFIFAALSAWYEAVKQFKILEARGNIDV